MASKKKISLDSIAEMNKKDLLSTLAALRESGESSGNEGKYIRRRLRDEYDHFVSGRDDGEHKVAKKKKPAEKTKSTARGAKKKTTAKKTTKKRAKASAEE